MYISLQRGPAVEIFHGTGFETLRTLGLSLGYNTDLFAKEIFCLTFFIEMKFRENEHYDFLPSQKYLLSDFFWGKKKVYGLS